MPEMTAATAACHLRPHHAVAVVLVLLDPSLGDRPGKQEADGWAASVRRGQGHRRSIPPGTAGGRIIEHSENDRYWGDGGDGSGRNKLGQILMEVRKGLRSP